MTARPSSPRTVRRSAFLLAPALAVLLALCTSARAASAWVDGSTLRVSAAPGERNALSVFAGTGGAGAPVLTVSEDRGRPPTAGAGCLPALTTDRVTCPSAGVAAVELDGGDGDDGLAVFAPLVARVQGGEGNDVLRTAEGADVLDGGAGDDLLDGRGGDDVVLGGLGDDSLAGGPGADGLDGGLGSDLADGGEGDDSIVMRDRLPDSVLCGLGRDGVRAEVLDSLDFSCEQVDYGPPGHVGRLLSRRGGGRFVPVPGQPGATVDRRILPGVLYLIRRYHVRIGDGFSLGADHSARGEHPLGLAVDVYPGAGGSWSSVDRLARWAEPRQNHPRPPFRWVGYNGDVNHGRGNHLHLSWQHSPGRRGRPVRMVWVFAVRTGGVVAGLSAPPPAVPADYPRRLGPPDR